MKEEASKLSQRRKECYKDTEEDILINQLDEKRKTLRNKTIRTEKEKLEYAELRKTVKKTRSMRARRKRKEHIKIILTPRKGPSEALKSNHKKIIGELRTEDNEKDVDR